jgi:hypothetical protein
MEYLEKNNYSDIAEIEKKSYLWVKKFHFHIYERMIEQIKSEDIISEFYLAVLEQTHKA